MAGSPYPNSIHTANFTPNAGGFGVDATVSVAGFSTADVAHIQMTETHQPQPVTPRWQAAGNDAGNAETGGPQPDTPRWQNGGGDAGNARNAETAENAENAGPGPLIPRAGGGAAGASAR